MRKRGEIEKESKPYLSDAWGGTWDNKQLLGLILEVLLDIRALVGIKDILEKLEKDDLSNSLLKDGTPF